MNNKLHMKDILLVALLTAIYFIIYMLVLLIIVPLGAFGHTISPGISSILNGTILYFMSRKVGKMWQFTLSQLFLMGVFSLIGSFYIPWFITTMIGAIIADLIASRSNDTSTLKLGIASAFIHLGQALGGIIPALFFMESYRDTWIKRGQTPETMEIIIHYSSGHWALIGIVIICFMSIIGIYIGRFILKKHFGED